MDYGLDEDKGRSVLVIQYIRTRLGYAAQPGSAEFVHGLNPTMRRSREMNKSTGSWERARQLLHAFADAGQPSTTGMQLFLGPNGGLMWTDAVHVDRSEPDPGTVSPTPEKLAPVDTEAPEIVRPQEPMASPVYTIS
jgi:hypothetical protein